MSDRADRPTLNLLALAASALMLGACQPRTEPASTAPVESAAVVSEGLELNTLSEDEQADGWRLLFNGENFEGWHIYNRGAPAAPWSVQEGAIGLAGGGGGDLITDEEFGPFELSLEWKISEGGNSGIIYLIHESSEIPNTYNTGPEMQVLDDAKHADGQIPSHRAGALYDFAEPFAEATKPVGEWNEARIVFTGDRIEHWLNGEKVAESSYGDDEWREKVAASKFATMPLFGTFDRGRIALQDHGDPVWYRNIKIRAL